MAGKVKVQLLVNSWNSIKGDIVEVTSEVAERMLRLGHATGVSPKAQAIEEQVTADQPSAQP